MRYVGGKSRIAGQIAAAILEDLGPEHRGVYIEPFLGGASVFGRLGPHFRLAMAGDSQPDIAMLWDAVLRDGWRPPEVVTLAEYEELRWAQPSPLRGFVGFGGSFGGKWFGGYARGGYEASGAPRNHQAESARAVARIAGWLEDTHTTVMHRPYDDWHVRAGDVVYSDPPYAGTQGYETGAFDSAAFWRRMDDWVERGARVYVSEYEAPPTWTPIWHAESRQSLAMADRRHSVTERLFTRRPVA